LKGCREGKMFELLVDNPNLFESYAIQDSRITVKHINEMGNDISS
jgi:hypothetical protein